MADELNSVPDTHVWPELHDHPFSEPVGHDAIPIVDLTAPNAATFIGHACESWGVFQLIGHGVPAHLFEMVDAQAKCFFSLPLDVKMKVARPPGGLSGYGNALISSFFNKKMWSEGFNISCPPNEYASKLWPEDPEQFCDVVEEYRKVMNELSGKLLELILVSLGSTEEESKHVVDPFIGGPGGLQLNWYPACPDPGQAMGMASHTDAGLIAVLYQDGSASGLQVLRPKDQHGPTRWVTVPPIPGALVVNVGDLVHILSNARYRSVVHRAIVNRDWPRLSAVYFCVPVEGARVSPVALRAGTTPVYRGVTFKDYLGLRRRLFDKSMEALKMSSPEEEDVNARLVADQKISTAAQK